MQDKTEKNYKVGWLVIGSIFCLFVFSSSAFGYVLNNLGWANPDINFYMNHSGGNANSNTAEDGARAQWNDLSSCKVNIVDAGTTTNSNWSSNDGTNIYCWKTMSGSAIGTCATWTSGGRPVDTDIRIRINYGYWDVGNLLRTVIVHEFGHAIGLGHSPFSGAIMYYQASFSNDQLHSDDIAGARALYPGESWTIKSGDVNGDGRHDVICYSEDTGAMTDWLIDTDGSVMGSAVTIGTYDSSNVIRSIGNVDGSVNGTQDILIYRQSTGYLQLLRMDTDGTLISKVSVGTYDANNVIKGTGQFDADVNGTEDVLIHHATKGYIQVLRMDTDGTQIEKVHIGTFDSNNQVVGIGNIDGSNGTDDVLIYHTNKGYLQVLRMGAGGTLLEKVFIGTYESANQVVGVANIDGSNGTDDILIHHADKGYLQVLRMDTDGTQIEKVFIGNFDSNNVIAGVANFDGSVDGTADILIHHQTNGHLQILRMATDGTMIEKVLLGTYAVENEVVGIGDFDGSGTADVLIKNSDTHVIQLLRVNTDGTLIEKVVLGEPT